ncbi:pilus assembly protein TadG-related protein [Sulfitobacter sp. HNIBRBA3233]|uniref:TadE/TadG family type IV pilus assembly protein n=1 Tax=Sulfitobacter marinivivus TaxID=3158558 RepID=UPI0032DED78C
MSLTRAFGKYRQNDDGSMMVLWAVSLVVFLGLLGMIFDIGRLGTTQAELQSYADSAALAAAAELDGAPDALTRAQGAANALITDTQTFASGSKTLSGATDLTVTFYKPSRDGTFARDPSLVTTSPFDARFVDVTVADRDVPLGLDAVFASLSGHDTMTNSTTARAAATFEQEACNVAPIAMCLPLLDVEADALVGRSVSLDAKLGLDQMIPGSTRIVNSISHSVNGLGLCAGLLGRELAVCLGASRRPETACFGRGGLDLSLGVDIDGSDLSDAINTRFGEFSGLASDLVGDDFAGAPNILQGVLEGGVCEFVPGTEDAGLPTDDCLGSGTCGVIGNGNWELARTAYVDTYYDGNDPFPEAETRLEFYEAEIAAYGEVSAGGDGGGGLIGGLLGTVDDVVDSLIGNMCAPQETLDTSRRVMVVAAIDCVNVDVKAGVKAPVVQYFEAFALNPMRNGKLELELSACLGSGCDDGGKGTLDTDIRDVVRLVD